MKKIGLLHFAYPPNVGGVEIILREHALILSDLGHDILVATGFGREEENEKIKLIEVKELQSVYNFNPGLQKKILEKQVIDEEFYQLADTIKKKLEELLADREVVIVHNMLSISRNLPFIFAFKKYVKRSPDKKFIIFIHDHMFIGEERVRKDKLSKDSFEKELLTTPIEGAIYAAISDTLAKLVSKVLHLPREEIIVVPDGLNLKKFLEIDDLIWKLVLKHSLLQKFPLIVSPVNIVRRKNLEFSLEIVSYLKEFYPNILYIVSGQISRHKNTRSYYNFLKEKIAQLKIKDQVMFLGQETDEFLKDSQIHDLYQLADLIFYFSKSENFGLPVLEAAVTKTSIFTSNLRVFKEVGGKAGFYVDCSNVSTQNAAEKVKNHLEKNRAIKAFYRARTEFELTSIVKKKLVPLLG